MSKLLVEITRGTIVETKHYGSIAITDNTGKLLHSVGDPHYLTYWRSAAKPVQALSVIFARQ